MTVNLPPGDGLDIWQRGHTLVYLAGNLIGLTIEKTSIHGASDRAEHN